MLGAGRLAFGSVVPTMRNFDKDALIFVISSFAKSSNLERVLFDTDDRKPYDVISVSDDNCSSVAELYSIIERTGVRTVIIKESSNLLKELLEDIPSDITCFSACRDGLKKYITYFKNTVPNKKIIIHTFDNNHDLIMEASRMCSDNITIYEGMVHCVCSREVYSKSGSTVTISCHKKSMLFISSKYKGFKKLFSNPLIRDQRLKAFHIPEGCDKEYFEMKKAGVNTFHTILCILAIVKGIEKGLSIEDILDAGFTDILDTSQYLKIVENAYNDIYDKILKPIEVKIGDELIISKEITLDFVHSLVRPESSEKVKRGLNPLKSDFRDKLKYQEDTLECIEDECFVEVYNEFKKRYP